MKNLILVLVIVILAGFLMSCAGTKSNSRIGVVKVQLIEDFGTFQLKFEGDHDSKVNVIMGLLDRPIKDEDIIIENDSWILSYRFLLNYKQQIIDELANFPTRIMETDKPKFDILELGLIPIGILMLCFY